jgi:hypothetical protein
MTGSPARAYLRRQLEAHLDQLGYSQVRSSRAGTPVAEIARVSPVRGRLAYGQTVLHADLEEPRCHERLLFFSQRRTRHRSSILFFIGVSEEDQQELEALLEHLSIRNAVRGGHVHVVTIPLPSALPRPASAPDAPVRARRVAGRMLKNA